MVPRFNFKKAKESKTTGRIKPERVRKLCTNGTSVNFRHCAESRPSYFALPIQAFSIVSHTSCKVPKHEKGGLNAQCSSWVTLGTAVVRECHQNNTSRETTVKVGRRAWFQTLIVKNTVKQAAGLPRILGFATTLAGSCQLSMGSMGAAQRPQGDSTKNQLQLVLQERPAPTATAATVSHVTSASLERL